MRLEAILSDEENNTGAMQESRLYFLKKNNSYVWLRVGLRVVFPLKILILSPDSYFVLTGDLFRGNPSEIALDCIETNISWHPTYVTQL